MRRPGSTARRASTAAGGRRGPNGSPHRPGRSSPPRASPATPNSRPSSRPPAAMSRHAPNDGAPHFVFQPEEIRMTDDIVIVAAQRTAVGKFGGTLAKTPAPELGSAVIVDLLKRARLSGDQINEVILGQVLQAASGQNPARQTVIRSGLPQSVPAMTIN